MGVGGPAFRHSLVYKFKMIRLCAIPTAALPMDLQIIGPELVVEIGGEIKRRNILIYEIQTLNPIVY